MWIRPREVLVSGPLWTVERANPHFMLQRRKGRGTRGLSSLFVGTFDAVLESRYVVKSYCLNLTATKLQYSTVYQDFIVKGLDVLSGRPRTASSTKQRGPKFTSW